MEDSFVIVLDWLTGGHSEVAIIVILVLLLISVIGFSLNDGF